MAPIIHLEAGSTPPNAADPGKMRLYLSKWCPFSQRVLLIIMHHNIEFEAVYINLDNKPQWYIDKIPNGQVPVLEQDGQKLQDSEMICHFLDQLYPTTSLANQNSEQIAKDIWSMGFKSLHFFLFDKCDDENGGEIAKHHKSELVKSLGLFEIKLKEASPFLAGSSVGLADYLLYPMMERLPAALNCAETDSGNKLIKNEFNSRFATWCSAMSSLPSVQCCSITLEEHERFSRGKRSGDKSVWLI